ncbi:hypothetical protein HDE_01650 [Halotydeus destructor]|nr:hypothetical protein HDE_01650 [Halotydeus destructor]
MIGGFVLSLLADSPLNMMDTLAKMEASPLRPMVTKGSFLHKPMAEMPNRCIRAIGRRLVEGSESDYTDTQRRILRGERFALFQPMGPLKCAQRKLNERLIYIPPKTPDSTVFVSMLAIGYPKGSALRQLFDPL